MLGSPKNPNPEYWRARAGVTRALAHETLDPISKQRLIVLADSFDDFALSTEADDAEKQKSPSHRLRRKSPSAFLIAVP